MVLLTLQWLVNYFSHIFVPGDYKVILFPLQKLHNTFIELYCTVTSLALFALIPPLQYTFYAKITSLKTDETYIILKIWGFKIYVCLISPQRCLIYLICFGNVQLLLITI